MSNFAGSYYLHPGPRIYNPSLVNSFHPAGAAAYALTVMVIVIGVPLVVSISLFTYHNFWQLTLTDARQCRAMLIASCKSQDTSGTVGHGGIAVSLDYHLLSESECQEFWLHLFDYRLLGSIQVVIIAFTLLQGFD
ncbi:hypothetical protein Tco_1448872 [Tanacetum coccineum]